MTAPTTYLPEFLTMQQEIHYTCILISRSGCTNVCRLSVIGGRAGDGLDVLVYHSVGDDFQIMHLGNFARTPAIVPELAHAVSDAGEKIKELHGDTPPVWTCDRSSQGECEGEPHRAIDRDRGMIGSCVKHDPGYEERRARDRAMFPSFQKAEARDG